MTSQEEGVVPISDRTMLVTPRQRIGLTVGSFIASQSVMVIFHEGMMGTLIAVGVALASWSFAAEIFDKMSSVKRMIDS